MINGCMVTIPERKKNLEIVIDSIRPHVDILNIYLNYPEEEEIPDFLNQYWINVVHCCSDQGVGDLGSNGKYFFLDKIDDGYILIMDDDLVYPKNYSKVLINCIDKYNKKCPVSYHGGILPTNVDNFSEQRNKHYFNGVVHSDEFVNVIGTGVSGFHKSTIDMTLSDFKTKNIDDLYFAIYCQLNRIPMVVMAHPDWTFYDFDYSSSLWNSRKRHELQSFLVASKIKWSVYKICLKDHYQVNCGGEDIVGIDDNIAWEKDVYRTTGWSHQLSTDEQLNNYYLSYSYFPNVLQYKFYLTNNYEKHDFYVVLYFMETYHSSKNCRIFDVVINEQTLIEDFDIFDQVGSFQECKKEFIIQPQNGVIVVDLITKKDCATVSAIFSHQNTV
jgi:hypothetical protein